MLLDSFSSFFVLRNLIYNIYFSFADFLRPLLLQGDSISFAFNNEISIEISIEISLDNEISIADAIIDLRNLINFRCIIIISNSCSLKLCYKVILRSMKTLNGALFENSSIKIFCFSIIMIAYTIHVKNK